MRELLTSYDFKSEHNYYFDISLIDYREIDRIEETKIKTFISKGCYCSKGDNKTKCSKDPQFVKEIIRHRINITELDKRSQDFIILGLIAAGFKKDFKKITVNFVLMEKLFVKIHFYS